MLNKIVAEVFPYDSVHDTYQEYYRYALKTSLTENGGEYIETSDAYSDAILRKLRVIRHSYRLRNLLNRVHLPHLLDKLAENLSRGPLIGPAPTVGVYRFMTDQHPELTICIDANDFREISENAAASCDIYFKSNYWPDYPYPSHVLPLPNMNPIAGRNLELLCNLRKQPKEFDLFIFFRVWGGRGDVEGIEHNMALLKALSQVKCKSYIMAYLVAGDIPSLGRRLDDLGVSWTTDAMPPRELWKKAAAARLNIVRMGNHQCVPWRMIDILSMGGVPVMDYKPMTLWPEPLVEDKHYLNLDSPPNKEAQTGAITAKIDSWLQHPSLISSVSSNTADYFDRYLTPKMLGQAIIQTVQKQRS